MAVRSGTFTMQGVKLKLGNELLPKSSVPVRVSATITIPPSSEVFVPVYIDSDCIGFILSF